MMGLPPEGLDVAEEFRKDMVRESEEPDYAPRLEALIPDDRRLFVAMQYFLLASPARQLSQLGDVESLRRSGDQSKTAGDDLMARINYENAAKIALYEGDETAFETLLRLADSISGGQGEFGEYHRTLLIDVEKDVRIAKEYYSHIAKPPVETPSQAW